MQLHSKEKCFPNYSISRVLPSYFGKFHYSQPACFEEGNGNPLQFSCLENPMDRGAWQAAVCGVAKSRTRLSDFTFTFMHWRRKWQPTPVFLPGESQGRGSLVGCRLCGCTDSDMTEVTQQQQQQPACLPTLYPESLQITAYQHLQ